MTFVGVPWLGCGMQNEKKRLTKKCSVKGKNDGLMQNGTNVEAVGAMND
jgi:hypothetical protein